MCVVIDLSPSFGYPFAFSILSVVVSHEIHLASDVEMKGVTSVSGFRTPDQDRWAPLRRLEISFSQGAKWKALISKYIGTIPLSGDASCVAEQSISSGPPPRTPVSSAMMAKVGAAARHSQSAAPIVAALPFSQRIAPETRLPV
jgi:hypothetical protein